MTTPPMLVAWPWPAPGQPLSPPLALLLGDAVGWDSLTVFVLASVVSALSGIAAILRTEKEFTLFRVAVVTLNATLLGLGLAMVWYAYFEKNPNVLVGLCILVGLGGTSVLDVIVNAVKSGGLSISLKDGSLKIDAPDQKPDQKRDQRPGPEPDPKPDHKKPEASEEKSDER